MQLGVSSVIPKLFQQLIWSHLEIKIRIQSYRSINIAIIEHLLRQKLARLVTPS